MPTSQRLIDDEGLRCPGCGYNLTGNLAAGIERCPECGMRVRAGQADVQGEPSTPGEPTAADWQLSLIPAGLLSLGALWRALVAPDFALSILAAAAAAYVWGVRMARRRGQANPHAAAVLIGLANFALSFFAVSGVVFTVTSFMK